MATSILDRWRSLLVFLALLGVFSLVIASGRKDSGPSIAQRGSVEVLDYRRPQPPQDDRVIDDRIENKVTSFSPDLVDGRPLGDWLLNASDAVIRLDTPPIRPDAEGRLADLHPTYTAAIEAAKGASSGAEFLPSVSMIDGKAKRFDDGLSAALDLAYYRGLEGTLTSHVSLIRRMLEKVGPDSPASAYLSAGLMLAGEDHRVKDAEARTAWLSRFETNQVRSKPVGFYTSSKPLRDCSRFLRYFQSRLPRGETSVARTLADALQADSTLLADYKRAIAFYARLTDSTLDLTYADIAEGRARPSDVRRISLFPNSTSREAELFARLFPAGLPPDADLMRTMIAKIRSGDVSLEPRPLGGWYDYQVYALETLIHPDRGEERDKLLLTRAYKERMLDAFMATATKRREMHVGRVGSPTSETPTRISERVEPRLRVEPCPTYFLRTARAYGFLERFLVATLGESALKSLHGLKEGGERPLDLLSELRAMRELFYGLYLTSTEDIGLRLHFLAGEFVDRPRCQRTAADWLAGPLDDPDLAADTRVAVPVFFDRARSKTRLWTTLGVRLVKLDASYARPPSLKPTGGEAQWRKASPDQLGDRHYLIAVDAFAEVEKDCLCVPTREELRALCDRWKTRDAIVSALSSGD
jgi:hypothetical protein